MNLFQIAALSPAPPLVIVMSERDITERLRSGLHNADGVMIGGVSHDLRCLEAADEIDRLRARCAELEAENQKLEIYLATEGKRFEAAAARCAELEKALEPFAKRADTFPWNNPSSDRYEATGITIGMCRLARATLNQGQDND